MQKMTIDEAIQHCMDIAETQEMCSNGKKCAEEHRQLAEWLKELKALKEQEPCEDCISRQAVLEIQTKYAEHIGATKFWQMRDDIKALPSVTPQPKTGRWVDDKCSACGNGIDDLIESSEWYWNESPKYCPFCGANMQEVEE